MKRIIITILLALSLVGCGIIGKKPQAQVQTQTTAQISNTTHRLETIGALAVGVEATIPKQPDVAIELNKKVMTLAEEPTPAQVKQVMDSITNAEAKEALEKQVGKLIDEKRQVAEANNKLINNLANQNASLADAKKKAEEDLEELRNPFTAIWYGVKTLVMRLIYFLLGGTILFFILRTFAASSPIVGSIFSIFEHAVSFLLKAIYSLFPNAASITGHTPTTQHDSTQHALKVIVDAIETERIKNNAAIDPLLLNISKNSDAADKKVVADIKKMLGY